MEAKKLNKAPARAALGRGLSALISTPIQLRPVKGGVESGGEQEVAPAAPQVPQQQIATAQPLSSFEDGASIHSAAHGVATPQAAAEHSTVPSIRFVPVLDLYPNPLQPRKIFAEEELKELADSIKTKGVLQPILARPRASELGKYEIVAGERRWRAAQRAGLVEVPAVIRELEDGEALEISIIENVQRKELTAIEEAKAYDRLVQEFGLSQLAIAERVGKDRASIANTLRLLKLPEEIQGMLTRAEISFGHAKAILAVKESSAQLSLARKVVKESLTVRDLEAIVSRVVVLDSGKRLSRPGLLPNFEAEPRDLATQDGTDGSGTDASVSTAQTTRGEGAFQGVVDRMRQALGTKVVLKHHVSGRGRIDIEYFSEEELDRLVDKICG